MKTSIVIKKAIAFLTCLFMLCGVLSVNAEQTVTTVTQHTLPYYFGAITPSKIISGDINGDYFVNNKDLSRILQYLCGWDDIIYVEETLDVNGDNTVNSKDLIRLFKYLSGYDVQIFPLCEHTGGKATCHSKAKCELCGKEYGEFDATNHSGETEIRDSVDPTCTETGYTGDTYCLGCGVKLSNGTEIAALGHSFTNYVSDANETCTDDGTKTAKCDRCSATDTVLNAGSRLGHDFGEWSVTTPATCTEKGVETRICKRDASHTETRETPPLGHTGGKATCTAKAVCTRCNGEYGEIDPYYHPNANAQGAKEPTCTEVGHTGVFTCPDCHLVMSEDEVIPARGHSFTDYYSDNNVSCTQGGTKTARCIYCNLADTVADPDAPALGHDYNAVVTAPTCTQTGYTRYTCLRCKDSYVDSDTAALGHDYQAFVTAPTCTKQGYTTHACSRCDDSYVDNYTDAIGHNYQAFVTAPTCTKQGYTTHTCSRCNESYVDNYKMIGYTGTATYYEKAICNVCGKAHYTQMLAYDSLNQNQKDMYDYLNEKIAGFTRGYIYVFDYVEYVKNNPTRAESDINVVIRAISTDHPEYFWMPRNYAISKSTITSTGALSDIAIKFADKNDTSNGYYHVSDSQKASMQSAFDSKVNELLSRANNYATAFEKEVFIHDYLCSNVTYNWEAANDPTVDPFAFTAYGALIEGTCVCEGYARTMQLLCQRLGIPCSLATGRYTNENNEVIPHMWNIINPGDGCYYLDITFDDLDSELYPDLCTHFCFNIPKVSIEEDHLFDDPYNTDSDYSDPNVEFNFFDSHGNVTTMDYYLYNNAYISKNTLEAVVAYIDKMKNEGAKIADFLFDPDDYTPATAMKSINRMLMDDYGYDTRLDYGYGYHENWLFIMLAPTT